MARTINVRVSRAGFAAVARALPGALQQAGLDAGHRVEAVAVERVPYQEGDLARSVRVEETRSADGTQVTVGFYLPYAHYQHEGDFVHQQGRQHYLSSAVSDERATAYRMAAVAVRRLLS